MDEYINRKDANIAISEYICQMTVSQYGSVEDCRMARFGSERALGVLNSMPAADVVPKSEVDKLKETIVRLEQEKGEMLISATTDIPITYEALFEVRTEHPIFKAIESEVAREIIEIARSGAEKYINDVTLNEGIRNMLSIMLDDFIAELKKKYTEEQNNG